MKASAKISKRNETTKLLTTIFFGHDTNSPFICTQYGKRRRSDYLNRSFRNSVSLLSNLLSFFSIVLAELPQVFQCCQWHQVVDLFHIAFHIGLELLFYLITLNQNSWPDG